MTALEQALTVLRAINVMDRKRMLLPTDLWHEVIQTIGLLQNEIANAQSTKKAWLAEARKQLEGGGCES